MLWQTESDPHFLARITAGIAVYDGKVFVPVSSSEEFSNGMVFIGSGYAISSGNSAGNVLLAFGVD